MSDREQRGYGGQNMHGRLRRVLVRRPSQAFGAADPDLWNYTGAPDLGKARAEHDALVALLRAEGIEVLRHDAEQVGKADAQFVFDSVLMTDRGCVVLRMGKSLRRGEEKPLAERLEELGVPVFFALGGEATAEGGDCLWVDSTTLAVGMGFRTNDEGLRQLTAGLANLGVEVVPVELPYFSGPRDCLHLLSLISMLDRDLAVVHPALLPVRFLRWLEERGVARVDVPAEELATMGPNVLALAPRRCLALDGNPITRRRLEAAGCEVLTYRGDELSVRAEGGPTCLTQPILRDS
jgi:N-dimethylarginine dimethylaminohydrolase